MPSPRYVVASSFPSSFFFFLLPLELSASSSLLWPWLRRLFRNQGRQCRSIRKRSFAQLGILLSCFVYSILALFLLSFFFVLDSFSPLDQVEHTYTGPLNTELATSLINCDPEGPVVVQVSKLYHTADAQEFRAFGRVMSGTLKRGKGVKVLGEGYSPDDEEDMVSAEVEGLWVSESRYVIRSWLKSL